MNKVKTYIDTVVVSAYVAWPPTSPLQHTQWAVVQALWETAERRGIRFVASRYIIEEAEKGHKGVAAKRLNALKKVTLLPETAKIKEAAHELIDTLANEADRKRLLGDARHLSCAVACKAKYVVTWNLKDFNLLSGIAMTLGWEDLPDVLSPADAAFMLGSSVFDNPGGVVDSMNRKTPWIQKILKETKAVQIKISTKELADHDRK